MERVTCNRCQFNWLPNSTRIPKQCPACRSPYWNKPRVREFAVTARSRARAIEPVQVSQRVS